MGKAKYFPNNWEHWNNAPEGWSNNETPTFNEFMEWRVGGWDLPSSVNCIVRATNKDTGRVQEFVYNTDGNAVKKIQQLILENNYDITIVNHDTVQVYTRG